MTHAKAKLFFPSHVLWAAKVTFPIQFVQYRQLNSDILIAGSLHLVHSLMLLTTLRVNLLLMSLPHFFVSHPYNIRIS
jgi:hypothetical protein